MKQGRISCAKQINQLTEMINGAAYKEKYMYGISFLKDVIEEYGRECICRRGCSPVKTVDFRIKSAGSIADKLGKKGYGVSCENAINCLSDLAGVRVVCFSVEDVYALEKFLGSRNDIVIIRRKDYIKKPKANGYQSLHLITELDYRSEKVCVEVQLRTTDMHRWAENDHKQFYKKLTK